MHNVSNSTATNHSLLPPTAPEQTKAYRQLSSRVLQKRTVILEQIHGFSRMGVRDSALYQRRLGFAFDSLVPGAVVLVDDIRVPASHAICLIMRSDRGRADNKPSGERCDRTHSMI